MTLVLTDVEHRGEDYELDPVVIEALWKMEDEHFWHAARNRWVAQALRANGVGRGAGVLDLGCGSGVVARYLHHLGYHVTGVDTAEPLLRRAHDRCPAATFVLTEIRDAPAFEGTFDAICLLDVLEHLDDPESMIEAGRQYAHAGTVLVATVPAHQSLHTVIDDLSGHKRRYEPGELAALLERAGLSGIEERGIFRLITPAVRRARRSYHNVDGESLGIDGYRAVMVEHVRVPAPPVNKTLGALCAIERTLGSRASRNRSGSSLLATGTFS